MGQMRGAWSLVQLAKIQNKNTEHRGGYGSEESGTGLRR